MPMRSAISLLMLIGMLCASSTAQALDETRYPDWKGQWVRAHGAEAAPWAAPFEANLKQRAAGVQASDPAARCILFVMPCAMVAIHPMEIVTMRHTLRRISTDERARPKEHSRSMMAD